MSVTMRSAGRRLTTTAVAVAAAAGLALTCLTPAANAATGTDRQYVSLRLASDIGQTADVDGGSTANSAKIIQWTSTDSRNQLWRDEAVGDGYYRFANAKSGKCLNVEGGGTANLTRVIQWTCGTSANEQWRPVRKGNGYQLVARSSNKCLNVDGGAGKGRVLIQYTCSAKGGANDVWLISQEPTR